MFKSAIEAPLDDKKFLFNVELKRNLNLPSHFNSFYDQKVGSGAYERLWELTVISLCSDIEFFLKDLFSEVLKSSAHGRGFYQRFQEVIPCLQEFGMNFEDILDDLNSILECFQVRHIATHNMGYIDETFTRNVSTDQELGQRFQIDQEAYRRYYDSYVAFLQRVDASLA